MHYQILYSSEAEIHLRTLTAREQRIVLEAVEEQLAYEPLEQTRNRKPMRPNPVAPWELRIGALRVYYEVDETPEPKVFVLAVGVKKGNRVRIGGEEIQL